MDCFHYPLDTETLLRKKRKLRRELLAQNPHPLHKKIAILGGSTTNEVADQLGLFLLLAALPVTGALAAAALRRYGAETERVRQLFDVTMVEYAAKAELVERARMYRNCAISVGGEIAPEARVAIAQAANDLLRIQGVDASFVAVQVGNGVNVSARSMGAVNVQVIMESLGGGGHQTMAAAQLKHITPQAARSRIQDAIDQYYLSQKKTTPEARPAKGE